MKRIIVFFSMALVYLQFSISFYAQNEFSVESWRDHLPYSNSSEIVQVGDFIYASTPYSIVQLNIKTNEITRLSKVNGLSETGIAQIVGSNSYNTLVIGYNSSNIDLIKDGEIVNMSAILNSTLIGDKTINELYIIDQFVYVCTGFGIVVIDLMRQEVKDTYIIGQNNTQLRVKDIHISADSIFALTDLGILAANRNANFLSDYSNWNLISQPSSGNIESLESVGDDFLAFGNQNIIYSYNGQWHTIINQPTEELRNVRYIDQKLVVATSSYVTLYEMDLMLLQDTSVLFYALNGVTGITPNDFYITSEYYWLSDEKRGFYRLTDNFNAEAIANSGPYTNEAFHLSCKNDYLFVSAGRVDGTNWNKTFNWHGVFSFDQSNWTMYNQITNAEMALDIDTVSDILSVTPHHTNQNEFFASSYGGGLLHFNDGQLVERYSYYNSSLQPRIGQNSNVLVSSSAFDSQGNLWVANPYTNNPISVLTPQGEWQSFYCGNQAADKLCTSLIVDNQYGYIWMIVKGLGLVVYDFNQTPLDYSDDQYTYVTTSNGSGSLPSAYVNSVAIDLNGVVWIGTDNGPVQFYSSYPIFNESNYNAQRILIEDNGTIQYLLENQIINDIEIDGANRKWIATNGGGLFLMSEDGTNTIYAFSSLNSPLFSNQVNTLALNNKTGELYIASEDGIQGFKSTATESHFSFKSLKAYPNPVRENFFGNIAILGMMANSEVKVTDANGVLISNIISEGGQAVWNGKNLENEFVQPGVYYFFATSEDGYNKAKGKVLIIR